MEPSPNNTRYILELERKALVKERINFDEKYGTFCFLFLEAFQVVAVLAYLFIAVFLIFTKKIRSKTNVIVTIWALINMVVLGDRAFRFFTAFITSGDEVVVRENSLCQMLFGLAKLYGSSLVLVWLYLKYFEEPKARYSLLLYFFILLPAFVCAYYTFYYYNVDRYIYEVFGPGCDVVSAAIYLLAAFLFLFCKIFVSTERSTSTYPLFMSLANLITSLPISLITIYLRFNLDVAWSYRFHIHFVDLFVNLFTASNAFMTLFLVLLYHKCLNKFFRGKVKSFGDDEEKVDWF